MFLFIYFKQLAYLLKSVFPQQIIMYYWMDIELTLNTNS